MMSANNNMINAGPGVDLPKQKVRIQGLGRGFIQKNKRQSPPTSPCGSSTNVLATRSGTVNLDGGWKLFYSGAAPGWQTVCQIGFLWDQGSVF